MSLNNEKNNGFEDLIEKLFKNKVRWLTKKRLTLMSFSFISLTAPIVTVAILLTSKNNSAIGSLVNDADKRNAYEFNGQTFETKEEAYNYAYNNVKQRQISYNDEIYKIDDQLFTNATDLNEYLMNKFKIEKENTLRNPSNYTINSSGELSGDVVTSKKEKVVQVYKGNDQGAYLSKEESLETFLNYDSSIFIGHNEFNNEHDARNYYENIKIDELNNQKNKTECFIQSGICQTEEEIKNWLNKNMNVGFEYNGQTFSDYNYSEYIKTMTPLDPKLSRDYIKEVKNADKSSYWAQLENIDLDTGYIIGPKYFETSEDLNEKIVKFEKVGSTDINPILTVGYANALSLMTTANINDKFNFKKQTESSDFEFYNYIQFLNSKGVFDKMNINNSIIYAENMIKQFDDASVELDQITDSEFTNFHKLLVLFNRILTKSKIFDIGYDFDELEKKFVEIIAYILNSESEMLDKIFGSSPIEKGFDAILEFSFRDLYSLFINIDEFKSTGGLNQVLLNGLQKVQQITNEFMTELEDATDKLPKNADEFSNNGEIKQDKAKTKLIETTNEISTELNKNGNSYYKAIGLNKPKDKNNGTSKPGIGSASNFIPGLNLITKIWSISQLLSFMSITNYEARIDENVSFFYSVPTINLPIVKIPLKNYDPGISLIELSGSILDYLIPRDYDSSDTRVYEFNNKYYINRDVAEEILIRDAYKQPEKYFSSNKLITSIMNSTENYYLKDEKFKYPINSAKGFTYSEYQSEIAIEKQEYTNDLFEKHYRLNSQKFYLDGFGGAFDTKAAAMNSLKENLAKENFDKRYYYIQKNAEKIYRNSEEEIIKFIKENESIESKYVINSDLIKTSIYDSLETFETDRHIVFKLNFYGRIKFFKTYMQAWNYIKNNVNYNVIDTNGNISTFDFEDNHFINENDFKSWLENEIKEVPLLEGDEYYE